MGTEKPQSGDRATGVDEQIEGSGDEGRRAAGASPRIEQEGESGQTQTPAAADDTGVPPDEEMNER